MSQLTSLGEININMLDTMNFICQLILDQEYQYFIFTINKRAINFQYKFGDCEFGNIVILYP